MLERAGMSSTDGMVRRSTVLSDHVLLVSLALCMATFLAWNLSFTLLKGDHHGVGPLLLADGKLWIGPLYRGGEKAIRTEGWNVGVASWTLSEGVWGGRWRSFSLELWPVVFMSAAPAIIRSRVIQCGLTNGPGEHCKVVPASERRHANH